MQFELTNEQRKYLGLEPIGDTWELIQMDEEIFLWFDGEIIRRKIAVTDSSYSEDILEERTENNRTILLPKTSRGKPRKLNSYQMRERQGIGVHFYFINDSVGICSNKTQTTFYSADLGEKYGSGFVALKNWLAEWISDTTAEDLAELERFKTAERKHVRYKEGDFFTFKIGRREYGFGRILLDIVKLRKSESFKKQKNYGLEFMGTPVIVKIYHRISNAPKADIEELEECGSFPSGQVMDNVFLYGEYAIIGNKPLKPCELEFPISYRRNGKYAVYLQYGLIYKETDISKFSKYLYYENLRDFDISNPYRNEGIGWKPCALWDEDLYRKCVEAKSNEQYWNSGKHYVKHDLRNPALHEIKAEIFNYFGLDPDASYSENLSRI